MFSACEAARGGKANLFCAALLDGCRAGVLDAIRRQFIFAQLNNETRMVRTKVLLELFALVEEKVGVEHDGIMTRVKTRRERLREVHTRISKLRK